MAKKSSVQKQLKREKLVRTNFDKRQALKKTILNMFVSDEEREQAKIKLNKMRRDTSPVRLRNRCQLTGRSRGFLRKFKLSRLCFRDMACNGEIPGVTKSSW